MFKRIVFGATALAMFCAHIPQAFAYYPVGNTALIPKNEQATLPIMITGEFGYTFDESETNSYTASGHGKISYMDLLDGRIRPYITLGGLKYATANTSKKQTSGELIWGVGLDGTLYEWTDQGITLFGSIGYREAELNLREVNDDHSDYKLFETSLGVAKKLGAATVYGGVSYWNVKDVTLFSVGTVDFLSQDTEDNTEPFLGVNFQISDTITLGFEVSQFDSNISTFISYSMQF